MTTIKNLFAAITTTFKPESKGAATREEKSISRRAHCEKLLGQLVEWKRVVRVYDSKDKATRKIVAKQLNLSPGKAVEVAIKAVRFGATLDDFTGVKIAERVQWSLAADAIFEAMSESKLSDEAKTILATALGLIEKGDHVATPAEGERASEANEANEASEASEAVEEMKDVTAEVVETIAQLAKPAVAPVRRGRRNRAA